VTIDGVEVIALLFKKEFIVPKLILIANYRIPIRDYCLEFPAGLIDKDEPYEVCGLRELKEETGYTGTVFTEFN